jgi:hypothetical protein
MMEGLMDGPPTLEDLDFDQLRRVVARSRMVKELMSHRLTALIAENAELMAVVQELQVELAMLRQRDDDLSLHGTPNGPGQQH